MGLINVSKIMENLPMRVMSLMGSFKGKTITFTGVDRFGRLRGYVGIDKGFGIIVTDNKKLYGVIKKAKKYE